jgi:hypothetical protein
MNIVQRNECALTGGDAAAVVERYMRDHPVRVEGGWQQALLRSVCASSAGVVVLIAGYEPYLPRVGTSPSVLDTRAWAPANSAVAPSSVARGRFRELIALATADQVREVLAALSLNRSQLAEVLHVSRPTLYDWLDGREPNVANSERLLSLLRLLNRAGVDSSNPVNPRFMRQPLSEGGISLLDLLLAGSLDSERVLSVLQEARALGDEADAQRRAREERLRALGFEEPTSDQRKAQLAKNVALRDWPKT